MCELFIFISLFIHTFFVSHLKSCLLYCTRIASARRFANCLYTLHMIYILLSALRTVVELWIPQILKLLAIWVASHFIISLDVDAESLNNCEPVCNSCEKQRLGTLFAKGTGESLSQGSADLPPGMCLVSPAWLYCSRWWTLWGTKPSAATRPYPRPGFSYNSISWRFLQLSDTAGNQVLSFCSFQGLPFDLKPRIGSGFVWRYSRI